MERRSRAILQRADDGGAWLMVKLDHMPNLDHIETVAGSKEQFYVDWELADTRRVRKKQRRLFFALLNDIVDHFCTTRFLERHVLSTVSVLYRQRD